MQRVQSSKERIIVKSPLSHETQVKFYFYEKLSSTTALLRHYNDRMHICKQYKMCACLIFEIIQN